MKLKLLKFKEDLSENIINQDLIISSSGLTKYQILYFKIPFIIFCENKKQEVLNKGFEEKNLCPVLKNLSKKNINSNKNKIKKFIKNFSLRESYLVNVCRIKNYNVLQNFEVI